MRRPAIPPGLRPVLVVAALLAPALLVWPIARADQAPPGREAAPAPAPIDPHGAPQVAPTISDEARLDALYASLRRAADAEEAQRLEAEIYVAMTRPASPTVEVLMTGAATAEAEQDPVAARGLYERAVEIAPDHAEAHARLAGLSYAEGDFAAARLELRRALRLEPRHCAAWAGLGAVLEESGELDAAADAYREALYWNPLFDGARRGLLRVEARTRGIAM